jgi:hypothetical protein
MTLVTGNMLWWCGLVPSFSSTLKFLGLVDCFSSENYAEPCYHGADALSFFVVLDLINLILPFVFDSGWMLCSPSIMELVCIVCSGGLSLSWN